MSSTSTTRLQPNLAPPADDPRNLTNVPAEILQMFFPVIFHRAIMISHCRKSDVCRKSHAIFGNWQILLASQRFYLEGIDVWYEMATLSADDILPAHLPRLMVLRC